MLILETTKIDTLNNTVSEIIEQESKNSSQIEALKIILSGSELNFSVKTLTTLLHKAAEDIEYLELAQIALNTISLSVDLS